MTMQTQVRDHYRAQSLRPEKLAELTSLATPRWERWVLPAAVAAIVLVAVTLAANTPDRTALVGQEIASNHAHAHGLEPELEFTDFEEMGDRMDRLDFEPRLPERIGRRGLRVVGARYCSVQGRIAAQVRLTDDGGQPFTLYLVRAFGSVRDSVAIHDGIRVELWRDGDLLMGLAGGEK